MSGDGSDGAATTADAQAPTQMPDAEQAGDWTAREAGAPDEVLPHHQPPRERPVTPLTIAHWLLCPALFVAGCWLAAAAPERFAAALPRPRYSWLLGGPAATGVQTLLHKLPRSMAAAWQLGRLASLIEASQGGRAGGAAEGALQEAAAILHVPAQQLSADDVVQLGARLTEFEARRGVASRLAGALSFVNLMWGGAIVGLTISVGPVVAIVCQPAFAIAARLLQRAAAVAVRLARAAEPLWEVAIYSCCLYIIGAAQRYPPDSAGLIAATGCALALPAFLYSARRHLAGASGGGGAFSAVLNAYLCLVLAPTAVTYQSGLLGFGAAAALYSAVGFSVLPTGLCWYIGFDGTDSMARAAATAGVVLSALVGLRAADVDGRYIDPFRLGLSCLGGITLFLAGLIRCSLYYDQWGRGRDSDAAARAAYRHWVATNGGYLALLVASAAAGSIYGLPALSNTAATFFALWIGEKSAEFLKGRLIWLSIFGGSITLWQAALFLRSRPDFLATMLAW